MKCKFYWGWIHVPSNPMIDGCKLIKNWENFSRNNITCSMNV